MKKLLVILILLCFSMTLTVKAEEEPSKIDVIVEEYENIKSTQTYAMIVMIVGAVGSIVYAVGYAKNKIKKIKEIVTGVDSDTSSLKNTMLGLEDEVKDLTKVIKEYQCEIGVYQEEILKLKESINNTEEIARLGFKSDPKLVVDGTAEKIAMVGKSNEDIG